MSVDRFMCLLTEEEFEQAKTKINYGGMWYHNTPNQAFCIDFGDARDTLEDGTPLDEWCETVWGKNAAENIERLKILWQRSSTMYPDEWQKVQEAIDANPQLNIYFFWD